MYFNVNTSEREEKSQKACSQIRMKDEQQLQMFFSMFQFFTTRRSNRLSPSGDR